MQWKSLEQFKFALPKDFIASNPCRPRDSAKLLVYNRQINVYKHTRFFNLLSYLPKKTVLVFNNSQVIRARIIGQKTSGGKVEVLFLKNKGNKNFLVMLSRFVNNKESLILAGGLEIIIKAKKDRFYVIECKLEWLDLIRYLNKFGTMPLPPYIKNTSKQAILSRQYQTVFAKIPGSVAAPTASLHFTKRLLAKLKKSGIKTVFVTLHVGAGTFLPLSEMQFKTNKLHKEWYEINKKDWQNLLDYKKQGYKIIAVGTTSVRTLETVANSEILTGETDLFIKPGFNFKIVSGLITNFHLPGSSLLLLVASFIKSRRKTLELYQVAINRNYRFYSFGDANLIL